MVVEVEVGKVPDLSLVVALVYGSTLEAKQLLLLARSLVHSTWYLLPCLTTAGVTLPRSNPQRGRHLGFSSTFLSPLLLSLPPYPSPSCFHVGSATSFRMTIVFSPFLH